ncbi:MAG: N-acetylmuramate alpha-1-phosphate uridylyltransferase MurU [Woeseiaceae bacterium]
MKAMILAAGRGERLRPLTDNLPKSLVEVRDKSLLEHHLERLQEAGIKTVVINLGWLGEKIVERIGAGSRYGLNVIYSQEGDNVLETGGGILKALPILGSRPFLTVNADIFTDMPVPDVALEGKVMGHLMMVSTPVYRDHGDFDLDDGLICNSDDAALTFSGVAVYRPEFFAGCEAGRFPLAPMLREAADAGQLTGSLHNGVWTDVGTQGRLDELNRP